MGFLWTDYGLWPVIAEKESLIFLYYSILPPFQCLGRIFMGTIIKVGHAWASPSKFTPNNTLSL
jgi:hypothetical protein